MSTIHRALRAVGLTIAIAACGEGTTNPDGNNPPPPPGPAPVATIQLGAIPPLVVGKTAQLTAVAKDAQGKALEGRAMTWTSSAEAVATVNATGLVTGLSAGPATITVTSEGKTANAAINVLPIPVASVAVDPEAATIKTGRDMTLGAVLKDEANNELPGRAVTWTSEDPSIATVDPITGKVTGVSAGTVVIKAVSEGKIGSAEITVIPAAVATVAIDPAELELRLGRDQTLAAVLKDEDGEALSGRAVAWTSSKPAVATVDAATGKVVAVSLGQATITATSEGKSAQAVVTVVPVPVSSVTLEPATASLKLEETLGLTAVAKDENGTELAGRAFTYATSNPAVATVSAAGLVTAVDVGQATITATSEGKKATSAITVSAPVATVTIAHALDTVEAYDFQQLQVTLKDAKGRVINGRPVQWASSNEAVATVDGEGMLSAIDRGAVTITATAEGKVGMVTRVVVIKYRSITAATQHACNIASGGIAWCWGLNGVQGRLGSDDVGDGAMSTVPFRVQGDLRFTQLASYARTTCGIAVGGSAYCWGWNGWDIMGAGSNLPFSAAPLPVAGGHTFKQLATGAEHACGLTTAGQMLCWGRNDWRQLGTGTTIPGSPVPVAVAGNRIFTHITTGTATTCGVAADGSAWCWGANSIGQVGDGGKISYGNVYMAQPNQVVGGLSFKAISAANQHTCALTTGGQAYCWGSNNTKLGTNGNDSSAPIAVSGGHTFKTISAGFGHSCGVTTGSLVYCWGSNGSGQLGSPVLNSSGTPVQAANGMLASEVAASGIGTGSGSHTCAISADRLTVQCWGRNDTGQLGNGATTAGATANVNPSIVVGQKPLPPI